MLLEEGRQRTKKNPWKLKNPTRGLKDKFEKLPQKAEQKDKDR